MKSLIAISALTLAWCSAARGEQVVREVSWAALKQSGGLTAGEVVLSPAGSSGPAEHLKVENSAQQPKTLQVLVLDKPGISSVRYGVQGLVRYQDAASGSHLEVWNHFPGGGAFFSRTLADSGPMQQIEGSSAWRPFLLPFFSDEKAGPPNRLEINVVLAGSGTVCLSPLRLVQYDPGEDPLVVPGALWSERMGGWIGGIAGSVLGCLGGLIGILVGLGKARRLVMTLAWVIVVAGILLLLAGLLTLILRQPYAVYYPLLLIGLIASLVVGLQIRTLRRRYEQIDLRKMAAADLGATSTPRGNSGNPRS
jgi:hypothetical protein